MPDRVPSDHETVRTIRATIARRGASRPRIDVPEDDADAFPDDDVVRLVIDGTTRFARLERGFADGVPRIADAHDTPEEARSPGDGPNRLAEWFESSDRSFGSSAAIDVIEPGFAYGLREPGDRAVYDAVEAPDSGLASIARRAERDRGE